MATNNHLPSLARAACAIALAAFALPTFAAIPVRWTVDTFRVKPLVYDCYHGETLDLAADMTAYGEPLNLAGKTAHLFWQTNGMAGVYWQTNAAVRVSSAATNVLAAVFSGLFDPGASEVQGFIGVDGENYRAAFTLRFRPSPGFVPSALPLPTAVIDCAMVSFTHPEAAPFVQRGEIPAPDLSPATNYANAVAVAATNYTDDCGRTLAAAQTNFTRTATNDLAVTLRGEIAAQTPGNYAAVSNAAMTAVQPAELDDYLPTSYKTDPNETFAGTANFATIANNASEAAHASSADSAINADIATAAMDAARAERVYNSEQSAFDVGIYFFQTPESSEYRLAVGAGYVGVADKKFAYLSELPSTNGFIKAEADPIWTANSNNFANVLLSVAERTTASKITNQMALNYAATDLPAATNGTQKTALKRDIPSTYLASASSTANSITVTPNTGAATTLSVQYNYALVTAASQASVAPQSGQIVSVDVATPANGIDLTLPTVVAGESADFELRVTSAAATQFNSITLGTGETIDFLCDSLLESGKIESGTTYIYFTRSSATTWQVNAQKVKATYVPSSGYTVTISSTSPNGESYKYSTDGSTWITPTVTTVSGVSILYVKLVSSQHTGTYLTTSEGDWSFDSMPSGTIQQKTLTQDFTISGWYWDW